MPPTGGNGRLASGELREMVVGYLRQHPKQEFGPSALGSALGRSSGAIANICGSSEAAEAADKLVAAVSEALTQLAAEGLAMRVADSGGGDDGGTWRLASGRVSDEAAATLDNASGGEAHTRLRPGALRSRVLEFVRAQAGVEFSPTTVARSLKASSGAVSNALERLVELGEVARTSDKPRRFAADTAVRGKRRS